MTFVRARIPPSHKSATNISNYHYAVIGFGSQSSDHLCLLPPYDLIYCWKCFWYPSKKGSLSMCRHLAALLLPISFPQEYRSTFKAVNLFIATGPESRQAMRVLPPITESQPIPLNIPRRSRNTRQNIVFYDLSSSPRTQPSSTATSSSGQTAGTPSAPASCSHYSTCSISPNCDCTCPNSHNSCFTCPSSHIYLSSFSTICSLASTCSTTYSYTHSYS